MEKPKSITSFQLMVTLSTTIIGVGILAFPRITTDYVSTGAPFATFFAILMMMCPGAILAYLGGKFPQQTLFEYAEMLIGKWPGKLILLCISVFYLHIAAMAAREFGDVVVTSVLTQTPTSVITIMMMLLAMIACRYDVAVFARIQTVYMPLVYLPAIIIVILSLKNAKVVNVMPLLAFFYGQSPSAVFHSTLIVAALFQNYMVLGLLVPFMYRPKRALRGTFIGMGLAGALYIMLIYATLAVFGTEELKNLMWPTLELAKTTTFPMFFLERLDPLFLAVWMTAVFCALYAAYFVAVQAISHLFGLKNHRPVSLLVLPAVALFSKQPSNVAMLYRTIQSVGMLGLILTIGYPLLLLILYFVRHRKAKRSTKAGPAT